MLFDDQALLERTGYTLDVTTGQRKYGGPPPESAQSGAQPTIGTEVQPCHSMWQWWPWLRVVTCGWSAFPLAVVSKWWHFMICSNHGYGDSLPLRADWTPFHLDATFLLVLFQVQSLRVLMPLISFLLHLADICRQNPQRPFWGWVGSAVWESRPHLGPPPDDGSSQWPEQRLCLCHFLH